jgi:hypothetical protein
MSNDQEKFSFSYGWDILYIPPYHLNTESQHWSASELPDLVDEDTTSFIPMTGFESNFYIPGILLAFRESHGIAIKHYRVKSRIVRQIDMEGNGKREVVVKCWVTVICWSSPLLASFQSWKSWNIEGVKEDFKCFDGDPLAGHWW